MKPSETDDVLHRIASKIEISKSPIEGFVGSKKVLLAMNGTLKTISFTEQEFTLLEAILDQACRMVHASGGDEYEDLGFEDPEQAVYDLSNKIDNA